MPTDLTPLEKELCEAMERRDAKVAECPIDHPRYGGKAPEFCPRCRARSNQGCEVKNGANYMLVSDIRGLIAKAKDHTNG